MITFRDKFFKNKLDPKAVYYDCIQNCEINTSIEKVLEDCEYMCSIKLSTKEGHKYLKANFQKR